LNGPDLVAVSELFLKSPQLGSAVTHRLDRANLEHRYCEKEMQNDRTIETIAIHAGARKSQLIGASF